MIVFDKLWDTMAEKGISTYLLREKSGIDSKTIRRLRANENIETKDTSSIGRTSMNFFTAFRLSLNNLLTKKARTILVSFAGSIGIIGIALVQAVSNGFQGYVDSIQQDTLTSYPLTIMQETTDVTSMLLSMTSQESDSAQETETVQEKQYISDMLSSLSTNDLKNFKHYLENNYEEIEKDISSIKYSYSVEPTIYTTDATGKIAKLNPSNLFKSQYSSSMMSALTSIYSQMTDNKEAITNSYDILAGRLPEKYDEMIIVLSEPNTISDLLIYSLGLRDTEELSEIVAKVMNGEAVDINNKPLTLSYEDLMNIKLKLILQTDAYKYNEKYDIYEDMLQDEEYLKDLYNKAIDLKIVGVVCPKEGTTSMMLNPGVLYTSDLIDYIIDSSLKTDIVKKQLEDTEKDVFSGSKFDDKKNELGLDFQDLVSIDSEKLEKAFNVKIDQKALEKQTQNYMTEITNSITTDTQPAKKDFANGLNTLANGVFESIEGEFGIEDIDKIVANYLNKSEPSKILNSLETKYVIPKATFKQAYTGLLKSLLQIYINTYNNMSQFLPPGGITGSGSQSSNNENTENNNQGNIENNTENSNINNENVNNSNSENNEAINQVASNKNIAKIEKVSAQINSQKITNNYEKIANNENNAQSGKAVVNKQIISSILSAFTSSAAIEQTENTMAKVMTETVMKRDILTKVGELTANLTNSFASAFNVDQEKIASAFQLKMTEEEITRIVTAMMSDTQTTAKTNLISLGYQDKDEPTYISFYFDSFDGKENFINFIDTYNEKMEANGDEEKVINYTDTTGILMESVKTIVSAVTYVLIAFISISLIVSSIMIGIITYISVYERTKEIGILRAIGASKHNISSIFNAETFIIGLLSGLFGIGISYALIPIINTVLHYFTGNIPLNVTLYFTNAAILVALSIILTLIGGLIPAKAASKKDPVIALRTE